MIQTHSLGFSSTGGQFPPMPTATAVFGTGSFGTHQTSGVLRTSNVMVAPTAANYSNIPMPCSVKIPGYTFPNISMQQNYLLTASSDYNRLPNDASFSSISTKIICPQCGQARMTKIQSQLGCASYAWCLMLLPLVCTGLCCICLPQCKDKIHYCNCGSIVGYHRNSVC